jgi:hypothetical protein
MHVLLIDWLRQIHLNADTTLATKRWKLAQAFAKKATRKDVVQLLRAFLFSPAPADLISTLTTQMLALDKEFPASNNAEEVRLIAGVIMVAAFEEGTHEADAFALGIKACSFPSSRCKPAQPAIVAEAEKYMITEANRVRPPAFGTAKDREAIATELEGFVAGTASNEAEPTKSACAELAEALHSRYGLQLRRLAEETSVLWWLIGGYSPSLNQPMAKLNASAYAFIAAAEAVERISVLPPPPSMPAVMARVLDNCKAAKTRTLLDVVAATDPDWRSKFLPSLARDGCADLLPVTTALAKTEEVGDTETLAKTLPKACPGVSPDLAISAHDAATQFYNELIFIKALALVD